MTKQRFEYGDQVRHPKRPEWGVGSVIKVENVKQHGEFDQRLAVRFASAGLKTVLTSQANLQAHTENSAAGPEALHDDHTLADAEANSEGGWLGEISNARPEKAMTALAPGATDPFLPLRSRLEFTLNLYRFKPEGGELISWAVAQSGLRDPLSRFNRHELEEFYKRWSYQRDQHLLKLLGEARSKPAMIEELARKAPPQGRHALQKLSANR